MRPPTRQRPGPKTRPAASRGALPRLQPQRSADRVIRYPLGVCLTHAEEREAIAVHLDAMARNLEALSVRPDLLDAALLRSLANYAAKLAARLEAVTA